MFVNLFKFFSHDLFFTTYRYEAVNAPHSDNLWAGLGWLVFFSSFCYIGYILEYGGSSSLLDGSTNHGNWFYSVGSVREWNGGMCA